MKYLEKLLKVCIYLYYNGSSFKTNSTLYKGLPNVSPVNNSFIPGPGNLKISWKAPDQSNCESFNALLDGGYVYKFKGNSPWNKVWMPFYLITGVQNMH